MMQIDERKKEQEVREITSGVLFQRLKQRAEELRRRRDAADKQGGFEDTL
jgi:hypothetical protein